MIYRPIDLNNPFPGESGNGRTSGSNWIGSAYVLGQYRSFIDAYITNNRGKVTEQVYQMRPMFQFYLTSGNISAIRNYNSARRREGFDYNDFNLTCTNGEYCKSEFLQSGLGNGYFRFTTENSDGGSCFNATSTTWESCRYTG